MQLNDGIKTINGISDKRALLYKRLGIETVRQLIEHYPKGYIDFTNTTPIANLELEGDCVVKAIVHEKRPPFFGKIPVYKVILEDESGMITCTFFNSEYSYSQLITGREYIFWGRLNKSQYSLEIINPVFISSDDPHKLLPKYSLTKGLTNPIISSNIKMALRQLEGYRTDELVNLPKETLDEYKLLPVFEAIKKIHFPISTEESIVAKKSLVFKELFALQLGLLTIRSRNRKLTGARMNDIQSFKIKLDEFRGNLPFKQTNAQKRAAADCFKDMKKSVPMNRLLQGDVGSGKTVVAAEIAFYAHLNGFQTALMVPTEILAKQHYETLKKFLSYHSVNVCLVTGGMTAKEKRECQKTIKSGESTVIVGTHALIQKGIEFSNLGLVITDEQHRFGVSQRSELISKGVNPHTLVMSATPIPRTLGLIIYGDLDISLLDEMPAGRIPIKTYSVPISFRERLYKFILKQVGEGRQAYIVCPLVEEGVYTSPTVEKASAVKYQALLKETWFKDIETGLLHGRMKQSDKDKVMKRFKDNEIKVLISTTVIEVGVDVPNATVMLIENAEQFGLSQLHQLRGRVGRGSEQSHCILVANSNSPYTKARLDTMTSTTNGFEIAGKDLELRGPGDFFGQKQHGLPLLKIGNMAADTEVLSETQILAKKILEQDPTLEENKDLKPLIKELFEGSDEYGFN